jgi:hypothetical protein
VQKPGCVTLCPVLLLQQFLHEQATQSSFHPGFIPICLEIACGIETIFFVVTVEIME